MTQEPGAASADWLWLPADLPVPVDDGAADHLVGLAVPPIALQSTDGSAVDLAALPRRTIVYAYPRTGRPGEPPIVADWDSIPGARGCTPESCGFRDHHGELDQLGFDVYGLSTQSTEYQREVAERLQLPFALLSDADLKLTHALRLPTITVAGQTLLHRFTLVIDAGAITHIWYPVFPPNTHAAEVTAWAETA
jgi:peroxiredoxin